MTDWKEVWERLPVERKDKSLTAISGFDTCLKTKNDECKFRRKIHQLLLYKMMSSSRCETICEIGCGCGDKLKMLYKDMVDPTSPQKVQNLDATNFFGADYSSTMIERAKIEMPKANLVCCDASKTPFDTQSMDFVFSYSVFQYFKDLDAAADVVNEMLRITKPGGTICIWDVPDAGDTDSERPGHLRYQPQFFRAFLHEQVCKVLSVEYFYLPYYGNSLHRFNVTASEVNFETTQ